ncbi:hypothetical protein COOONC_19057, partial [Cooperia oncophora]
MVSGAEGLGAAADRIEAVLCHLLIPLFLRTATKPKEASIIQGKDLTFCLSLMQHAISPPAGKHSSTPLGNTSTLATSFIRGTQHDMSGRQGSVSVTDRGHSATVSTLRIVRDSVSQCIYLGGFLFLNISLFIGENPQSDDALFWELLTPMWPRVARLVKDLISKKQGGQSACQFIDFVLHAELPIALLILPVIQNRRILALLKPTSNYYLPAAEFSQSCYGSQ